MDRDKLRYWLSLSRKSVKKEIPESGSNATARSTPAWIDEEIDRAEEEGVMLLTRDGAGYPPSLLNTPDPPPLLDAKGGYAGESAPDWSAPAVAVVGTRKPTHFGLAMAERLGAELAGAGITIVSGMARGCDSAAHKGALKVGGATVAVLGTGIDVVYPPENSALYYEIAEKGLLISELPFGAPPRQHHFPLRNRIISGLVLGVIVVEAPLKSGAMMTARLALEDGREVMAVPGKAGLTKNAGTNKLIKDGAALVETAEDIVEVLGLERLGIERTPLYEEERKKEVGRPLASGEAVIMDLFDHFNNEPMQIDDIAEKAGVPIQEVSALLLTLELKGLVEQRPGKLFFKRHI